MKVSDIRKLVKDFSKSLAADKEMDEWWGTNKDIWDDISYRFISWCEKNRKKLYAMDGLIPVMLSHNVSDKPVIDLAIKFNNTDSYVNCYSCEKNFDVDVGYQITLRDTFDFICDECVDVLAPELKVALKAIKEST